MERAILFIELPGSHDLPDPWAVAQVFDTVTGLTEDLDIDDFEVDL